jgi:hypothetical protein
VKIGAEEFGHEIADKIDAMSARARHDRRLGRGEEVDVHILQGRDEDIAKADDLVRRRTVLGEMGRRGKRCRDSRFRAGCA